MRCIQYKGCPKLSPLRVSARLQSMESICIIFGTLQHCFVPCRLHLVALYCVPPSDKLKNAVFTDENQARPLHSMFIYFKHLHQFALLLTSLCVTIFINAELTHVCKRKCVSKIMQIVYRVLKKWAYKCTGLILGHPSVIVKRPYLFKLTCLT